MGKVIHGNRNFGFAPIVTSGNTKTFGTPVMIPGMVSATIEVEQEDTNIYSDDDVYCVVKGAKVRTATVTLRNIPAEYMPYLGFKATANGGFVDTGTFANHCIFFETQGDDCSDGTKTPMLHYLYNVKASEPTWETNTDEEEVEAAELEVSYTAQTSEFVVDADNVACQYYRIERSTTNATLYNGFKTTVILPTSV